MKLRGWDGRALITAVCLGLSLGMSGYAAFRPLAPSAPPDIPVRALGICEAHTLAERRGSTPYVLCTDINALP